MEALRRHSDSGDSWRVTPNHGHHSKAQTPHCQTCLGFFIPSKKCYSSKANNQYPQGMLGRHLLQFFSPALLEQVKGARATSRELIAQITKHFWFLGADWGPSRRTCQRFLSQSTSAGLELGCETRTAGYLKHILGDSLIKNYFEAAPLGGLVPARPGGSGDPLDGNLWRCFPWRRAWDGCAGWCEAGSDAGSGGCGRSGGGDGQSRLSRFPRPEIPSGWRQRSGAAVVPLCFPPRLATESAPVRVCPGAGGMRLGAG